MSNLGLAALNVAGQLGRTDVDGTTIIDLEDEIKEEIRNSIRHYNRKPWSFTEVRNLTFETEQGQTWYSTLAASDAAGEQALAATVAADDVLSFHYLRVEDGLNDDLTQVGYTYFETLFEGTVPEGRPELWTLYAGQIGLWNTPSGAETVTVSATVKPVVPQNDGSGSVWFDKANELIEAAAAGRVAKKHLRDPERAALFASVEGEQLDVITSESVRKINSTGRVRVHY